MQGVPNRRGCRAGTPADELEACGRAPNTTYQYDFPWRISLYEFVVSGFCNYACMFKLKRRSFLRPGSIRRRKRRFDTRTNSQKEDQEGQWRHGRRRISGGGYGQKGRSACRKRWELIEVTRTLGESVVVSVEYERRSTRSLCISIQAWTYGCINMYSQHLQPILDRIVCCLLEDRWYEVANLSDTLATTMTRSGNISGQIHGPSTTNAEA
jgi:hypothetical protein